jgi:hypothetical protein
LDLPQFAKDKPLGRFLRSADLSAKLRAYPFVASLAVRQREYLDAKDKTQLGYEVQIVLHHKSDDDSKGFRGWYQVWDNGQAIWGLGISEWNNAPSPSK